MPSLDWICQRVRRAHTITLVIGNRVPATLQKVVLDAYQRGAALVLWTVRGYDAAVVSALLDLALLIKHCDLQSSGAVLIDRREGWFISSGLPVDHPEHAVRMLERTQVAEWVRFRGRVDRVDAAGRQFTMADLPHVTLHGILPPAVAVPGAFVQITALRSTALGQEAYHPHDLHVVEITPRAHDALTHQVDKAVAAVSGGVFGVPCPPPLQHLLEAHGFANLVDVDTYLQEHGISGAFVTTTVAAYMPAADPSLAPAVWAMIAMALQARAAEPYGILSSFAPVLRALISPEMAVGRDGHAERLLTVTWALAAGVGEVLGVLSARARVDAFLLKHLRRLTRDLHVLTGHRVMALVEAPGPRDEVRVNARRIRVRTVSSPRPLREFSDSEPGVILVTDAAPWTLDVAAALRTGGSLDDRSRSLLVGLDDGATSHVDLCVTGSARDRDETLRTAGLHAGNLEMMSVLVYAAKTVETARSRLRGVPSRVIRAGTGGNS